MKVTVKKDRNLIIVNARNTQNENDVETIEITVPEEYEDFNKKIAFITDDGVVWDFIENNKYTLTKAITKYKKVKFYIWLTQDNKDFRSEERTIVFNKNQDANKEVTEEEISGFNKMINILEEEITEVTGLQEDLTNLINTVQTKLDNGDFVGPQGPQGEPGESYDDTEIKEEITDIKEEQTTQNTRIEELEEQVQELESNQLTGTSTGQSIYIEDSTNAKVRSIGLSGNSEQESTTGKQLFNANAIANTDIIIDNDGKTIKMPIVTSAVGYVDTNKKLSELCPEIQVGDTVYLYFERSLGTNYNNFIYFRGYNQTWSNGTSKTIIQEMLDSGVVLYGNRYNEGETTQCILTNFRIVKNSSDEWEPYTGGQASPNPSYPQEIHSTGDSGSVNEKVQNKNLWDKGDYFISNSETRSIPQDFFASDYKWVNEIVNFTVSAFITLGNNDTRTNPRLNIELYYTDGTTNNQNSNTVTTYNKTRYQVSATRDVNKEISKIRVRLADYGSNSGNVWNMIVEDVQLEQGTTATDYVAHEEQDISFPLAEGQKLMQGDYLADDGIHHVRGEVDLSTLTWSSLGSNLYRSTPINNIKIPENASTIPFMFAEKYKARMQAGSFSNGEIAIMGTGSFAGDLLVCDETGTPTGLIQYPLAQETTEDFTEEQQAVWEQIKALRTYKPVTHISSTDEVPATVDITYVKDWETVINNLGGA